MNGRALSSGDYHLQRVKWPQVCARCGTDTASCPILDLVSNLLETFFFGVKVTWNRVENEFLSYPKHFLFFCFLWVWRIYWTTVEFLPPEPAGLKSVLKAELNLSHACSKDSEPQPSSLLCSVLQALAIQGDLQHKIKLFSKSKQCSSLLNMHFFYLSTHTFHTLNSLNVIFTPHFYRIVTSMSAEQNVWV